jgi:hypothetical protein
MHYRSSTSAGDSPLLPAASEIAARQPREQRVYIAVMQPSPDFGHFIHLTKLKLILCLIPSG